ncbi:metal ABC transporter ATP-binding protein [Spirulina sp. CS-785/01]|uniref:metal ABC transporter ATP-binding protein n=1 Tax=Spirulina sp. CS-785/01 TaxID=3021716 RepID=UPI002330A180|nr:metal ABC transporter ATP-binding protein [Spirulina sp. CS-785/01]MDB9311728.1 metal ABC transporter ATP-binding protein [Spirulina sp. CS-785/01]
MLDVRHLTAGYRGNCAIRDISFSLIPGQLTCLLGPNGAGKSTLIKAMLGLISASEGQILLDNKPLKQQLARVAYVPQRNNIDWDYPITVSKVVMMGRIRQTGWFRSPSRYSRELVKNALKRVEMSDYQDCPIGELSGGQQQRVFLARALVQQADVFCFDEPFNGIDQKTEGIIFEVFKELKTEKKILLVISHDFSDNLANYEQLLLINQALIAAGKQDEVLTDCNLEKAYGKRFSLVTVL